MKLQQKAKRRTIMVGKYIIYGDVQFYFYYTSILKFVTLFPVL